MWQLETKIYKQVETKLCKLKENKRIRLDHYHGSLLLTEITIFPKLLIKLTPISILKNQENTFVIMKPAVKPQYVRMAKTGLNFHFSPQLMVNPVFLYLFLEYDFQRHYVFALPKTRILQKLEWRVMNLMKRKWEERRAEESIPWLLWRDRPYRICLCPVVFRSRSLLRTILVLDFLLLLLFEKSFSWFWHDAKLIFFVLSVRDCRNEREVEPREAIWEDQEFEF